MESRTVTATKRPGTYSAVRGRGTQSKNSKKNRGRIGLFAIGTIVAVVLSMTWNPPHDKVHSFTTASDYRSDRESGCTNSGKGCHGSESSYKDFNAYHKDAECTDCHDYQGVGCIPCHAPKEHECALCHDGSMKVAPDRVRLTDSYPNGHYRETTHTVTATDMTEKIDVGGKASSACSDCHASELRGAHTAITPAKGSEYGADIGCGECHNDLKSFGQAEVLSDWKQRSCESCHKVGSSAPMHGKSKLPAVEAKSGFSCEGSGSGCHDSADLHKLHADKPKTCSGSAEKGEPGCHKLNGDGSKPTAKTCGGDGKHSCHRSSDASGYAHKHSDRHSPGSALARSSYKGVACSQCHDVAADGKSLIREHAKATSAITPGSKNSCLGCHEDKGSIETINDDWAARSGAEACSACHDGSGIDAAHGGFSSAHEATDSKGCASTGAGCHEGSDLASVGSIGLHKECATCHDSTPSGGNIAYSPGKTSCGKGRDCHSGKEFDPDAGTHGKGSTKVDGTDATYHLAGDKQAARKLVDKASGISTPCSTCHSMVLRIEHSRPNVDNASGTCQGCHNANGRVATVVRQGWSAKQTGEACSACHDDKAAREPHRNITGAHRATERNSQGEIATGYCSSARCHGTADVRKLHSKSGCTPSGCHSKVGDIRGLAQMSCGGNDSEQSCHASGTYHLRADGSHEGIEIGSSGAAAPGTCERAGCHANTDLMTLHRASGCQVPGCHNAVAPITSCGGPAGQAGSCHTAADRHKDIDTRHQVTQYNDSGKAVAGACNGSGCHESPDVRVIHSRTSCLTDDCHVAGGPKATGCGGPAGQPNSCHAGPERHQDSAAKHQATEIAANGSISPGACTASGCHATANVRTLHNSCTISGCHDGNGAQTMSCGGTDSATSCHTGVSIDHHPQDHSADLLGKVGGVTYGPSENQGCLGNCHDKNLVAEHRVRLIGGGLEGGGANVCAICHETVSGRGAYSTLSAVTSAIAKGDKRCVACHNSGSASDGPVAVGSRRSTCVAAVTTQASVDEASTPSAKKTPANNDRPAEKSDPLPGHGSSDSVDTSATPQAPSSDESETTDAADSSKAQDADPSGCERPSGESTAATTRISGELQESLCLECHTVQNN